MESNFRLFSIALMFLSVSGCIFQNRNLTMDVANWQDHSFLLNEVEVKFSIPSGVIGAHFDSKYTSTNDLNSNSRNLFLASYDQHFSFNAMFNYTHILLGVSRAGCCSIEKIAESVGDTIGNADVKKVVINKVTWVQYDYIDLDNVGAGDGDYVVRYKTIFDKKFNFFLTLRIDALIADIPDAVDYRKKAFERILETVVFSQ